VVDVEDVRVDLHLRVALGQFPRRDPVRGRSQPVQQARRGEQERADADGGDPGAVGRRVAQRLRDARRQFLGRVRDARQDDRVRLGQRFEPVRRAHGERPRAHLSGGGRRADPNPVRRAAVGQPRPAEGVDGGGQIEGDDPVQDQYGDGVHGGSLGSRRVSAKRAGEVTGGSRCDRRKQGRPAGAGPTGGSRADRRKQGRPAEAGPTGGSGGEAGAVRAVPPRRPGWLPWWAAWWAAHRHTWRESVALWHSCHFCTIFTRFSVAP
jgi:hypothetical protein